MNLIRWHCKKYMQSCCQLLSVIVSSVFQILHIDLPWSFLRWNRGLPRKLFLIFVSLVFHNWPPALLQVEPVITGGCAATGAPPIWGEPGGVITMKQKIKYFSIGFCDRTERLKLLFENVRTIAIFRLRK